MNGTMKASRITRVLLAVLAVVALTAGTASAQNEGRVSVGAGIDFATSYYFRGIVQETSGFIAQPYLEAGLSLYEGDNGSVSLAAGTWNSLHSAQTTVSSAGVHPGSTTRTTSTRVSASGSPAAGAPMSPTRPT